ncbi:MAG: hypothetical protein OEO21_04870 [Candidatus Krumholzibacteria bacterium]|nr:hypothetical protein [Candidatus Krumholzibacteria bacterium]
MGDRKRKSMGRDPFEDRKEDRRSDSVGKLIRGGPGAKEVEVTVRLTVSNLRHLDAVRARLAERGRSGVTRSDLIRIAITLLSADDVT